MSGRTVLIVDDQPLFCAAAARVLARGGFEVVGVAVDGADALRRVAELLPEVVLLDVGLPDMDGFEVARRLHARAGAPAVVLTSSREAREYGDAVRSAPVRGFVAKHELSSGRVTALLCAT